MTTVSERLAARGLTIPTVAAPVASYVPAVVTGNLVFTSGQLPFVAGELPATGKVGGAVSAEQATELAQLCALNAIAAAGSVIDIERVTRIVKLGVFVSSVPEFTGQPGVANGASDVMALAFGENGVHARSAVGVPALPLDSPVELDLVLEFS